MLNGSQVAAVRVGVLALVAAVELGLRDTVVATGVLPGRLIGVVGRAVALRVDALVRARDGATGRVLAAALVVVALPVLADGASEGHSRLQEAGSHKEHGRNLHGDDNGGCGGASDWFEL